MEYSIGYWEGYWRYWGEGIGGLAGTATVFISNGNQSGRRGERGEAIQYVRARDSMRETAHRQ